MHDMPESTARDLDKDSYSALTGQDPKGESSQLPGEEGVEASVANDQDTPASLPRSAADTQRIAHERALSDGVGGQG